MLVLFDIDGTLLLCDGAGAKAMQEAGKRVVGDAWDLGRVAFAGRLDPLIIADGARIAGVDADAALHARFRAAYGEALRQRLATAPTAYTLPGVDALVRRLRAADDVTLGLVTGNYPETGALKLKAAGLDPAWFPLAAWGEDGVDRRSLPPVAMARYEALTGRPIDATQTLVVGDTVHDVDCAHANGCLAVAVATGPAYTLDDLASSEPELLLEDLTDADAFVRFLDEHRG